MIMEHKTINQTRSEWSWWYFIFVATLLEVNLNYSTVRFQQKSFWNFIIPYFPKFLNEEVSEYWPQELRVGMNVII